ncbi:MAG: hypothetical protein AMXMBFR16_01720 [Candidatus Uhrbacteria bacterium]
MDPSAPKVLTHCPLCQASYQERGVRLLGESTGMTLYHLHCSACRHSVLAMIVENPHGIRSVGLVTDMEAQDAIRFQDLDPVSADDCVRMHLALDGQSREMCRRLLQR